jgi:citrate synthase
MPYIGGLYFLFMIGELPTEEEALDVENEWKERGHVPDYVYEMLDAMPCDTHPIPLFSQAVLALQRESLFARRWLEGMKKEEYWEPMLEDSMNLVAKLPAIAAYIYRVKCEEADMIKPRPDLDWGGNFAHMMGVKDEGYQDLSRLYFLLHSDHESGNVSAHTTHLVATALSDIYYAFSAGLNGLAGPLHGLANQESLRWLLQVRDKYGRVPSKEELKDFAWNTLNAGQVIPGYGHAVLRKTDPRFTALLEFGKENFPDDDLFALANLVYEVVPDVLREQGKAKDPWPNVDAISGVLQYHYGIREFDFYTVLFGIGRFLGVSANVVWARALGQPLERPKSLTTMMLEKMAQQEKQAS